ncbi:MAG: outer membrane protein assembly factor BamD [Verrucomicrobiota bacterium]|jgi:TolA-binding protein
MKKGRTRWGKGCGVLWSLGVFCVGFWREGQAAEAPELVRAREWLRQGAGVVAVEPLGQFLKKEGLSAAERREASLLLARAYVRGGEWEKVGPLLKEWQQEGEARFWMAEASLREGFEAEAAVGFEEAAQGGADRLACGLGRAEALAAMGRSGEALMELEALAREGFSGEELWVALAGLQLDLGHAGQARRWMQELVREKAAPSRAFRLLEGRCWLAENRLGEAEERFGTFLAPGAEVSAADYVTAALGQAEAQARGGRVAAAVKGLLQAVRAEREIPGAAPLFARLSEWCARSGESGLDEFREWTRLASGNRRALALFYLAQADFALGKTERAAEGLARLCSEFPVHPLRAQAFLQQAESAMESRRWERAEGLLAEGLGCCRDEVLRRALQFRQALVWFQQERYREALAGWEGLSGRDAEGEGLLRYYTALTALRLGEVGRTQAELRKLREWEGAGALASELELELAFQWAREGHEEAESALVLFLQGHPAHPRRPEAHIVLAELYFRRAAQSKSGPRAKEWEQKSAEALQAVVGHPASAQVTDQAAYLAVFLADTPSARDEAKVIELGERFLRERPQSPLVAEIRMKLGEVYLRRRDFANAETQYASVANGGAEGELLWTALYLAGQSASGLMNVGSVDRALEYWERVAHGAGTLRWEARYQQAAVKSRLGEEEKGIVLFDTILEAQEGVSTELRLSAQCGKGDALLALARRAGGSVEEALKAYRVLAEGPAVPPHWRNQAMYKIAKVREGISLTEALGDFYRVLDAPGSVEGGEFFWLFKAGFDAGRILEGMGKWRDAVALYDRLERLGGPRSEEAKGRARQLRLEHFLWD